ncbi:hypothetical protein DXG01_007362 [Tephrocybe rancida]|nr:hypothetical protein DXG01_007362 [Tephrocybe rancida]
MAKRRRSLQFLFIPSSLSAPPSPTTDLFSISSTNAGRSRSHSMANQSWDTVEPYNETPVDSPQDPLPPSFLLDDDPFANLSPSPANVYPTPSFTPTPTTPIESPPLTPRSPLTPSTPDAKPSFLSSPPPTSTLSMPGVSRTVSGRARPAYSKPAFAPRPSLPSLDTLARMNVVLARKARVRKGRVGAKLPFEPWDQPDAERSSGESSESTASQESSVQCTPLTTPSEELDSLTFSGRDDDTLTYGMDDATEISFASQLSSGGQDDSSYNADSELSLDSLDDDDYITSSELSYLSRSTSITSTSSNGSPEYQWPGFGSHHNISSAEESDFPNSPPDDFDFPQSRFDSYNIISSYWSSDDLLDSLSGDGPAGALFSDMLSESDMKYEPGTSAGTVRPSDIKYRDRSPSPPFQTPAVNDDEVVDGSGRENAYHGGTGFGGWAASGSSNARRVNGTSTSGDGRASGRGTNRFGGRGDDDDEDNRRRRVNHMFSNLSDSEAASDEESTDDYGEPAPVEAPSSDDDVPLAQRIPTALKAQNTIRRQVRDEREQRRAARTARAAVPSSSASARPPGAGGPSQRILMSSTQEAALHASRSIRRPVARMLPPASEAQPFSPDDLSKRLQTMEVTEPSSSGVQLSRARTTGRRDPAEKSSSRPGSAGRGLKDPMTSQPLLPSPPITSSTDPRPLRPSRSFHRPEGRRMLEEHHAIPLPADASKLARSLTRKEDGSPRSFPTRIQDDLSPKPSTRRSGEEPRKLTKYPETRSTRSSSEAERPRRLSPTRPPVPPLPTDALAASSSPPNVQRGPVIQQRVFIGDMQRFNMVEIGPSTNAGDVIEVVEAQGSLKGWVGSGEWMVWEIAQDFGMERPIRSFELLSDVQASWNKDKLMNTFVIKLTPLAVPLSRSAIPSVSPTYAGYVEWESKRGKWNKRWLHLREHSLWLSKRDNGRDEVLLCSLSNFDAYFITRLHKAPRNFSFALKSTDNLSFFENTADYLHIFSCGEKEGAAWMEHILLARSYVLYQERNVLFNPKVANGNAAGGPGGLSRAGTRKVTSAHRPAVQPLVSGVAAPMTIAQHLHANDVFEPGTLLGKHT